MPIGINVKGGPSFEANLQSLDKTKARQALASIQANLASQKGTGVLTLFNRTNTRKDMKLERKSGFQLFFRSQKRIDDTAVAIKTLLKQADLPDAVAALDGYLKDGKKNRIDSGRMRDILEQHLNPAESRAQAIKPAQAQAQPVTSAEAQSVKSAEIQAKPNVPSESKELTVKEEFAIGMYTTSGFSPTFNYRLVNDYLRKGCNFDAVDPTELRKLDDWKGRNQFLSHLKNLRSGLAKLPDFTGEVYRGTGLTPAQLENYKIGQAIVEPAFTSTSVSRDVGLKFLKKGFDDWKPVLFTFQSKHGKDIAQLSHLKHEAEVLFTAGSRFQVTGRSENAQGIVEIYLSELD